MKGKKDRRNMVVIRRRQRSEGAVALTNALLVLYTVGRYSNQREP